MTTSACWACGTPAAPTDAFAPFRFLRCPACGLAFRPEEQPGEAQAMYTGGDYGAAHDDVYTDAQSLPNRQREAQLRLATATEGVRPGARLFDVGAAGGIFVDQARRAGFDADGVEPGPAFVAYARERMGIELQHGTIETTDLPAGSVDLATMWHVLEHVADPAPQLERLRTWLAPEGRFVVEVPNAASRVAREAGTGWAHAQPAVHVSQFTAAALRALLERAGFRVLDVWAIAHDAYEPPRQRLRPGNLAHRLKWRGGEGELLLARAAAP